MDRTQPTPNILAHLKGGDRRSVRNVALVVKLVLADESLLPELIRGLEDSDPVVKMRSADALEKITVTHPRLLQPFKRLLINRIARDSQQEIRWHLAQIFPRLRLTKLETDQIVTLLQGYLHDKSSIVRSFSMQALADFASKDEKLKPAVIELIKELVEIGTPAMRARGKKLLKRLTQ